VGGCCVPKGCGEFFTEKTALRDAHRYRRKGLTGPGRRMVDFLAGRAAGATVLEVGGGVGAVQLELLKAGAGHAENVELSPAYERTAAELARDAGLEGRTQRRVMDFAERPAEVEPADLVVMNKVVCCYPDYEALVGAAAEHARRYLLLSFPRRTWWLRVGVRIANLYERLRRSSFRAYVHPPAAIVAAAEAHGLRPVLTHRSMVWQVAALERPG
jgi:hypothetical protein